jgi:hypothetical protein
VIARYALTFSAPALARLAPCADGDYVRWADHVAIVQERDAMIAAVREAGVLLATAYPSGDLPDQDAADLWCTAVTDWLASHEELIVTPPVKP